MKCSGSRNGTQITSGDTRLGESAGILAATAIPGSAVEPLTAITPVNNNPAGLDPFVAGYVRCVDAADSGDCRHRMVAATVLDQLRF